MELRTSKKLLPLWHLVDDTSETKPVTLSVTLNAKARAIIDKLREDTGIANTVAMERILEFFAGLDRKFRLAILNRDEETKRELAADVLAKMAGVDGTKATENTAAMTPAQMAKAAQFLVGRLENAAKLYEEEVIRLRKQGKK